MKRSDLVGIVCLVALLAVASPAREQRPPAQETKSEVQDSSIIIISRFDPAKLDVRKTKRALFAELVDSLKTFLAQRLSSRGWRAKAISGRFDPSVKSVAALMTEFKAAYLLSIDSLDVSFEETGETESLDSDGRSQYTTNYDLCTRARYGLHDSERMVADTSLTDCHYFTSRTTKASFRVQFGPDVVGKKEHAFEAVGKNAMKYLSTLSYFREN